MYFINGERGEFKIYLSSACNLLVLKNRIINFLKKLKNFVLY